MNKSGVVWMVLILISRIAIICSSELSHISIAEIIIYSVACGMFAKLFHDGKNIRIIIMCILMAFIGWITYVAFWALDLMGLEILGETSIWKDLITVFGYVGTIICAVRGLLGKA